MRDLVYVTNFYDITLYDLSTNRVEIEIYNNETGKTRIYDINFGIVKVEFNSESKKLLIYTTDDSHIYFNFENETEIVADIYEENGDYVDTFANWDFLNDEIII